MANPALSAVLAAAAQKSSGIIAPPDQLRKAGATNARAAIELDLKAEGSRAILDQYLKLGHIRPAGFGRYWLDEASVARDHAKGARLLMILVIFLISAGFSLWALLAR